MNLYLFIIMFIFIKKGSCGKLIMQPMNLQASGFVEADEPIFCNAIKRITH